MDLASQQYEAGYAGLLDLLVAQRDALAAESSRAASNALLRKSLVAIYAAAGGGWERRSKKRAKRDLAFIHLNKTAALIRASLLVGATLAGGTGSSGAPPRHGSTGAWTTAPWRSGRAPARVAAPCR